MSIKGQCTDALCKLPLFIPSLCFKRRLALGLLTSVIAKFKHTREFLEKIAEARVSLVPRVCVHVRTVEELSGIVDSPVSFDVFDHELRPEGKEDLSYFRAEHEPENISILQHI